MVLCKNGIEKVLMVRLGVNIDHIATLRQVRQGVEPDPCFAAMIAQTAGADAIVVHLREDRRHIKERDLFILKELVKVKLNLEMSVAADIVDIACKAKPDQVTLVPEKRQEVTTEGGLDVVACFGKIKAAASKIKKRAIDISLFIDPDKEQIDTSARLGIKMVELHTGRFAHASSHRERNMYYNQLVQAVSYARVRGMQVFAGHGLNYFNVMPVSRIEGIEELNIGYSIVCRAALTGLDSAVREMKALINK